MASLLDLVFQKTEDGQCWIAGTGLVTVPLANFLSVTLAPPTGVDAYIYKMEIFSTLEAHAKLLRNPTTDLPTTTLNKFNTRLDASPPAAKSAFKADPLTVAMSGGLTAALTLDVPPMRREVWEFYPVRVMAENVFGISVPAPALVGLDVSVNLYWFEVG